MNLYLDCEFDNGRLISMALVPGEGAAFYEVLPYGDVSEWVAQNVIPVLNRMPITRERFNLALKRFLNQFDSIHVIADWPDDIAYFCRALITGPGERMDTPPLTMEVIRIDAKSEIAHNALYDALAIKRAAIMEGACG